MLKACDVLVQQDIRDENTFGYKLSSGYISGKLRENALNILIPNLMGLGYAFFPYIIGNKNNAALRKDNPNVNGVFPRSIDILDEMLSKGFSEAEIVKRLRDEDLLANDSILNNFNYYIEKIRLREKKCDVKIADFIMSNYHSQKIFYDVGHPTNVVIEEKWKQICKLMGIKAELKAEVYNEMDSYEDPVLDCVKDTLGIQYDNDELRIKSTFALDEHIDLEEYVREYIWWRSKTIQGKS